MVLFGQIANRFGNSDDIFQGTKDQVCVSYFAVSHFCLLYCSFVRGLTLANIDSSPLESLMSKLTKSFRSSSEAQLSCGPPSVLYQSRILLPFLIALTSIFENIWALFLPTLFFAAGSIILWWKLTRHFVSDNKVSGLLVGIAPWLSPHFGGHVFLVLTEGPLIFLLLMILILTKSSIENFQYCLSMFII